MEPTNPIPPHPKPDIASLEQIRQMVDAFYTDVRKDPVLGPVFEEHIENWEIHLPTMYRFWQRVLFGTGEYLGNPFEKHVRLPVEGVHFKTWVKLFSHTVDRHFEGPNAEEAKRLARNIAGTFQVRMGIDPENAEHAVAHYTRHK